MPLYNYRCDACDHAVEVLQDMASPPLRECPECRRPALVKQISAPSFRLKGSGWYETDFKTSNKKNLAEYADDQSDTSAATSEKTAEKPAAATTPGKDEKARKGASTEPSARAGKTDSSSGNSSSGGEKT